MNARGFLCNSPSFSSQRSGRKSPASSPNSSLLRLTSIISIATVCPAGTNTSVIIRPSLPLIGSLRGRTSSTVASRTVNATGGSTRRASLYHHHAIRYRVSVCDSYQAVRAAYPKATPLTTTASKYGKLPSSSAVKLLLPSSSAARYASFSSALSLSCTPWWSDSAWSRKVKAVPVGIKSWSACSHQTMMYIC